MKYSLDLRSENLGCFRQAMVEKDKRCKKDLLEFREHHRRSGINQTSTAIGSKTVGRFFNETWIVSHFDRNNESTITCCHSNQVASAWRTLFWVRPRSGKTSCSSMIGDMYTCCMHGRRVRILGRYPGSSGCGAVVLFLGASLDGARGRCPLRRTRHACIQRVSLMIHK